MLTERQKRYREYLQSPDWKAKRTQKNPKNCAICNTTEGLQVHHLIYRNWVDVEMSDLRVLCDSCHQVFHELERSGRIRFKGTSHHSLFASMKHAVKIERGFGNRNMFT